MTIIRYKLFEVFMAVLIMPICFSLIHIVEGSRPLVTEFEVGAITGIVLVKLIEVWRIYIEGRR